MTEQRFYLIAFIIAWGILIGFVLFMNLCCVTPVIETYPPNAICMTQDALDSQLQQSFSDGYSKAKNEQTCDVCLKRLTLTELQDFLISDQCDRCGDEPTGCVDRAECLTKNARTNGYDCFGVIINFGTTSHALVAFPLNDGSLVFIEPLYDQKVELELGENYLDNFPGEHGPYIIQKIGVFGQ